MYRKTANLERTKKVVPSPRKIIVRTVKVKEPSLRDLFANYNGDYNGEELYWGEDVGGEVICD